MTLFAHGLSVQTIAPLTNIAQVIEHYGEHRVKEERLYRLKRAQIVIADYQLIRRDFPSVAHLSNSQIDQWLLDQSAYISPDQARQTVVNTKIPILEDNYRVAYRPHGYGRAHIFQASSPNSQAVMGLIDAKGTGAIFPSQKSHANGVATLGEAIREYLYEGLIRRVLFDSGLEHEYRTVGSYAVIDAGFEVIHADGTTSPAGLYLRQAHDRSTLPGAWLNGDQRTRIQSLFHRYGIDPNMNIQGTRSGLGIFDFGHYIVRDDLPSLDSSRAIPFELWGYDKTIRRPSRITGDDRWFYSKFDRPWIWSHELADAFVEGRADRHSVWLHFQNLLAPVEEKLNISRLKRGCHELMQSFIF